MINSMEILLQTGYRKIILSSDDMNSLVNKGHNEKGEIGPEKSHAFVLALDQKITVGHFLADLCGGRIRY